MGREGEAMGKPVEGSTGTVPPLFVVEEGATEA